jgi:hypothetical protein
MTRAFIAMRTGTPQRMSQGIQNCQRRATAAAPSTAMTRHCSTCGEELEGDAAEDLGVRGRTVRLHSIARSDSTQDGGSLQAVVIYAGVAGGAAGHGFGFEPGEARAP